LGRAHACIESSTHMTEIDVCAWQGPDSWCRRRTLTCHAIASGVALLLQGPLCLRGSHCRATGSGVARFTAAPPRTARQKRVIRMNFFRRWFIIWIHFKFGLFLFKSPYNRTNIGLNQYRANIPDLPLITCIIGSTTLALSHSRTTTILFPVGPRRHNEKRAFPPGKISSSSATPRLAPPRDDSAVSCGFGDVMGRDRRGGRMARWETEKEHIGGEGSDLHLRLREITGWSLPSFLPRNHGNICTCVEFFVRWRNIDYLLETEGILILWLIL
jgi:hypothetical protein